MGILNLGEQTVKDFVDDPNDTSRRGPLDLLICENCGLVQLRHTFSKDYLYSHYWYKSGTSPTMVKELRRIVESARRFVTLKEDDIVVDIGSNDGTLLEQYREIKLNKLGFEPSNIFKEGNLDQIKVVNGYFNDASYNELFPGKKAKIVTSIAMFYDIDDPNTFTIELKRILDKEGIWIIQMNYLGLMLKNLGYDNICHEHVCYYSLSSLRYLLELNNFEIVDAELNNVNGGSFRVTVKHSEDKTKKVNRTAIDRILKKESKLRLSETSTYSAFKRDIEKQSKTLNSLISKIAKTGKEILIYGASTRGLVILEFCKIDKDRVRYATDKNSDKWGKFLAGTGIKIISLEEYRKLNPSYLLILPYQYVNEITFQEREFLKKGGKMIIPLPKVRVIDKDFLTDRNEAEKEKFLKGYDRL